MCEGQVSKHELHRFRHLSPVAHTEQVQTLLNRRIVGFSGRELKRLRLLHKREVLHPHRSLTRVVKPWLQPHTRIVRRRTRHAGRQRHRRLRRKRILFLLCRLRSRSSRSSRRLSLQNPPTGTHHSRAKSHTGQTESESVHTVHRFSFKMPCIIPISALCVLSTSVAKSNRSASWPAPGVSKSCLTITSAPLWCCIIPVKNSRSNSAPLACRSPSICSGVTIPGMACIGLPLISISGIPGIAIDTASPRASSHRLMNFISSVCERLIRAPKERISLFSVCDGISAVISTACP